jgi:signal transduction histidine kinase/CheY-like chemotaxis protein
MIAEPIKVLLVEDNAGDARLIRLMLAEGDLPGYAATHVTCLGEALERLSAVSPAVILLDLNLPDAHGYQTFARVYQQAPSIPILLMTGLDDQVLATEVVRHGAQDYLVKGRFDANLLTHAIRYALERKRSESRIQYLLNRQIAINRLADALSRAADLAEIYRTISLHLSQLMDVETVLVSSYDDKNQLIRGEFLFTRGGGIEDAAWLPPIPLDPLGNSPQSQVILTGKALYIPDWGSVFQKASAFYLIKDGGEIARGLPEPGDRPEINSAILSPMQIEEKTVGVMQVQSYLLNAYSQEDVELFIALANVATLAVHNVTLLQDLRRSHADLLDERASLARRVEERTADLQAANADLARAARLKDDFLANMSHELRTPLNAVLGLGQALQEGAYGPINDQQMKALVGIEKSADHLLAVINDILDISKIEAGKLDLDLTYVDVQSLCDVSLQMVRPAAAKKKIQLQVAHDPLVESILVDERRAKQILVNLLSNAIKFTPDEGTVGLEVTGEVAEDMVRLSVWDTGIGIPPHAINMLFHRFIQLDSGLSRKYQGTGLGLVLVARLTELHAGTVSVESPVAVGHGSRFTVRLPWYRPSVAEAVGETNASADTAHPDPRHSRRTAQIVLAEDSPFNTEISAISVETVSHRAKVAGARQESS